MTGKVIITDFIAEPLEYERQILGEVADITALNAMHESDLAGRIEDADVVVIYHQLAIGSATIDRLNNCKLIIRGGVGFDNVDRAAARLRGIPVANVPDYGTEEVADSAIGMMLSLTRGIHLYDARLRRKAGPWSYSAAVPLVRLRGRVFGIIGLGRIGTATAVRAKALGMDVAFYDPYKPDGYDKAVGVRRVERLDDLLAQSFVLSLHCPLTEETWHVVGAAEIAKMPRGSYL